MLQTIKWCSRRVLLGRCRLQGRPSRGASARCSGVTSILHPCTCYVLKNCYMICQMFCFNWCSFQACRCQFRTSNLSTLMLYYTLSLRPCTSLKSFLTLPRFSMKLVSSTLAVLLRCTLPMLLPRSCSIPCCARECLSFTSSCHKVLVGCDKN
jgi:hypothetical protein